MLSHEQTRPAYDRIGALQDSLFFCEEPAARALLGYGDFTSAVPDEPFDRRRSRVPCGRQRPDLASGALAIRRRRLRARGSSPLST